MALGIGTTISLSMLGCGRSDQLAVSGSVTYQGQPVPVGTVYFEPSKGLGSNVTTGYALIKDGKFKTDFGKGCIPGPYQVRIQAYNGRPSQLEIDLAAERIAGREDQVAIAVGNPLCPEIVIDLEIQREAIPYSLELADFHQPAK